MALIVQKFGGSSVKDAERINNVADIVTSTYKEGNDVVVVVSAQGDTTDDLIAKAAEINEKPSKREMDMLLSSGEQISAALLAMAIERMGYPVVSLLGWQAGFDTSSDYGNARIKRVNAQRIEQELDKRRIVVVTGFQGVNRYGDMTTLGRGGSDTSAVAIAAAMHADLCQIFTDVDGVYTADPRKIPGAIKLSSISYDEMLELATLGAQVLHNRSVEMAKKYNIELEVLSSLTRRKGTIVKEESNVEKMLISGVAKTTTSPASPSSGCRISRAWPLKSSPSWPARGLTWTSFSSPSAATAPRISALPWTRTRWTTPLPCSSRTRRSGALPISSPTTTSQRCPLWAPAWRPIPAWQRRCSRRCSPAA